MQLRLGSILLLLLAFLACGCGGGGGGGFGGIGGESAVASGGPPLLGLSVSTGELSPAFSPQFRDYAISSLNALRDVQVTATAAEDTLLTLNGQEMTSGVPRAIRLDPGEDLRITATSASGGASTYRVSYLPPDFPGFTLWKDPGAAVAPGLVYLTSTLKGGVGYAFAVDSEGRVMYYQRTGILTTFDFKRHSLPGGRVRYSYFLESRDTPPNGTYTRGCARVLDEDFKPMADLQLLPFGGRGVRPTSNHDFVLLDDGHYLVTAYDDEVVDLSGLNPSWGHAATVVAGVVQEVKDGQVLLEWRSTDHPGLFLDSTEGNSFQDQGLSDYAHVNSVAVDPLDGNLLMSFRHLDEVLKVDRQTGQILWILGGRSDQFGLTPEQRFSHQHCATRTADGRLLLFDNGNATGHTRVLEFDLDESGRTVRSFRQVYGIGPDRLCSMFAGSSQALGGDDYLVGWGGIAWGGVHGGGLPGQPNVSEVQGGREIWTLRFLEPNTFTYRAFKF